MKKFSRLALLFSLSFISKENIGYVKFSDNKCLNYRTIDFYYYSSIFAYPQNDPTEHLILGNPSQANSTLNSPDNFLIVKHQFAESYNNSKGCANWVSWHLDPSWKGNAERCNCFSTDKHLPNNFNRIRPEEYSKTGFDRGHLCPSEDRDMNDQDNAATFLMSNMIPQSPNLNRISWLAVENYCRKLVDQGFELYIIAGGYGKGGIGSKGYADNIGQHHINVPSHCWKIIIALPLGNKDLDRINSKTTVLAFDMPNAPHVKQNKWQEYITSIDAIEEKTGYDFFSNLNKDIQYLIEYKITPL